MRISTFFYTIGQGFRNIIRNKWFSLASIATISACLFLFGVFFAILTNFQNIVKTVEKGVAVTVFFEEGIGDVRIAEIGDQIAKRVEVANLEYVSGDEAWESFKVEYLGEYADGFTENPLAGSSHYKIYLNDVSMQQALVTYLNSISDIRKINKSDLTATTLSGVDALVAYVSLGIIAILFAVSIFLISNTVTIGIAVRKEEINIMKYIGATDFIVRSPFVVEGILIGLIGSVLPMGFIYVLYDRILHHITERFEMLTRLLSFVPVEEVFRTLLPTAVVIGVGMGFLGSFVTVRKHLRV